MAAIVALCLIVALWLFPSLWFAVVKDKIHLEVVFESRYVIVGQQIGLQFVIENRAFLPCPFIDLVVQLPPGLAANADGTGRFIRFRTFVQAHQQVQAKAVCYAVQRGLQQMQYYPIYLTVNEGFGLKSLTLERVETSYMTVMPQFCSETTRLPEFRAIIGNVEKFHWLHPDESRLRGIREYEPGDPLKYIAWQASAREGKWMTKQFSASTDASVYLLLNAQMFAEYWLGTRLDEFDRLCELLVTFAAQLGEKRIQLKLATNALVPGFPKLSAFGVQSASSIRAIVGGLNPLPAQRFRQTLEHCAETAPVSESFIIFTSYEDRELQRIIEYERHRGRLIRAVYGPNADILSQRPDFTKTDTFEREA